MINRLNSEFVIMKNIIIGAFDTSIYTGVFVKIEQKQKLFTKKIIFLNILTIFFLSYVRVYVVIG